MSLVTFIIHSLRQNFQPKPQNGIFLSCFFVFLCEEYVKTRKRTSEDHYIMAY